MKKQLLIGAAAAVLIAGLAGGYGILGNKGAAGADNEPEIVLCYGEVNPEGHVLTDSAQYFADRVSELTGGRVMVEIYPSGQLGDDARCYQSMEMGALDLYRGNSMSLADSGNPMARRFEKLGQLNFNGDNLKYHVDYFSEMKIQRE